MRKIRWSRPGSGKQGGVRVIYYNRLADERIWLLLIYTKSAQDNLPAHVFSAARELLDRVAQERPEVLRELFLDQVA